MPKLSPCPKCSRHRLEGLLACPFCEEEGRKEGSSLAGKAGAALAGLALLAGCDALTPNPNASPSVEGSPVPVYGAPAPVGTTPAAQPGTPSPNTQNHGPTPSAATTPDAQPQNPSSFRPVPPYGVAPPEFPASGTQE